MSPHWSLILMSPDWFHETLVVSMSLMIPHWSPIVSSSHSETHESILVSIFLSESNESPLVSELMSPHLSPLVTLSLMNNQQYL